MGRRARHECFAIGDKFTHPAEGDAKAHERFHTACGQTFRADWGWRFTRNPDSIGCKACAAKVWPDLLAKTGLTLERVDIVTKGVSWNDPEHVSKKYDTDTKSLWAVKRGAEHVAWVYHIPGFGQGWQMSRHRIRRDLNTQKAKLADVIPGTHYRDRSFRFKEAAVIWLADEAATKGGGEVGKLEDRAAYLERSQREDREWKARQKQRQTEEQAAEAKAAADREEATAQLRELHARADLTNFQRSGLEWALEQLGIKLDAKVD